MTPHELAAQALQTDMQPVYPALVLNVEAGRLDVAASVYQGDEPFECLATHYIDTETAREMVNEASHTCVLGEEVELDEFRLTLEALDLGKPVYEV